MKIKKTHLAFFLLLITWFFLPSTLFVNEKTKVFDIISPDERYKVKVYHTKIISPLSFYKYLKDEDYYFILYDVDGGGFLSLLHFTAHLKLQHMILLNFHTAQIKNFFTLAK